MVIRVQAAALRWGYQLAGSLADCTMTCADGTWTVNGRVVTTDAFRVSQRPLVFEMQVGARRRRWPVTELQLANGTCSASLGSQES